MKRINYLLACALMASCTSNSEDATLDEVVLTSLSNQVVVHSYRELAEAGFKLDQMAQATQTPEEEAIVQLKSAWVEARKHWEQTEAFLFGPVDFNEIDPALDSWPLDQTAVAEFLTSTDEINQEVLIRNPEVRGFHLIEFLLWGVDGKKNASQFTEREWAFLKVATHDFASNTQALLHAWTEGEDAFGTHIITPGKGSYESPKEVYLEFAEGMAGIAAEMAESKIGAPLNKEGGSASPEEQESYFSDHSKSDLVNNLLSIRNIYNGRTDGQVGKGLGALVIAKNPSLDSEFQTKWNKAFEGVNQLPDSFTEAIQLHRDQVIRVQSDVRALQVFLESDFISFFNK